MHAVLRAKDKRLGNWGLSFNLIILLLDPGICCGLSSISKKDEQQAVL